MREDPWFITTDILYTLGVTGPMTVLESAYQTKLIKRIEIRFPGCIVLKNDPTELQGMPDLLILFIDTWAMLEVKLSADSPTQPNQEYYVEMFNDMSFASFIYPEIEGQVLDDLQSALWPGR